MLCFGVCPKRDRNVKFAYIIFPFSTKGHYGQRGEVYDTLIHLLLLVRNYYITVPMYALNIPGTV